MSAAPELEASLETCPNCGAPRVGRYCSSCGQKAEPIAPTLRYFLHELMQELANFDGRIFRSLRLLLTRPGFLTNEAFAGRRASYVSPIRLYLIMSIFAFAVSPLGGYDAVNGNYTTAPGEVADPAGVAAAAEAEDTVSQTLNTWMPRAMFVLVPLFAGLVTLFRRRSGHTYPQHLYFSLHVHAVWFFIVAIDSLIEALDPARRVASVFDRALELYFVGYFFLAFARVYGTKIWGTLWRTLAISVLYLFAMALTISAFMLPIIWPLLWGAPS